MVEQIHLWALCVGKKARRSFLKKSSKRLLLTKRVPVKPPVPRFAKVLCCFFQKKEALTFSTDAPLSLG
jgi:hypothetical protein